MTKSELHLQDTVFLGPGLLFLDQYFNSFMDEYVVLWIAMVSTFLVLLLNKFMGSYCVYSHFSQVSVASIFSLSSKCF